MIISDLFLVLGVVVIFVPIILAVCLVVFEKN